MAYFLPTGTEQPNAGHVLLPGATLEYLRLHLHGQEQKSNGMFGALRSLATRFP